MGAKLNQRFVKRTPPRTQPPFGKRGVVEVNREGNIFINKFYEVPLKDCDTEQKIAEWVKFLEGKAWATPRIIRLFQQAARGQG